MKKRLFIPVAAVALVGLMATFATTASAFPSKTTACTGCHSGSNIVVTTTLATTVGTTATYNFSATGADSVAVFDGATKIFTLGASGQFSVATGKTYTLNAVAGPGTGDGIGVATVSPVAAVVDATAPVTVSDAKTSYISSAAIKLTATDAGTGVATTYYVLDGGIQTAGTAVNVTTLGAHTLQFWSIDKAGNAEIRKTAAFAITAPVVLDTTAPVTVSDAKATYVSAAAIKLTATDAGTGVATTYYSLDGGTQVAGNIASVTTTGTHTLEFWSVDVAGNTEVRKSASFTVTAAVATPPAGTGHTVKIRIPKKHAHGHVATLTNQVTGEKFTAVIGKKGVTVFTNVPEGKYKLTVKTKKGIKTIRTVVVKAPQVDTDDDDDDDDHRNITRD